MALLNFLWVFENKQIFYEQNMIEQISIEKIWIWVHYFINQYWSYFQPFLNFRR